MERRGWDEKKDWGRGKKGSGEGMGGWVHEGKASRRGTVVGGALVLPSTTHPGVLDAGRPGCTVPGIAWEGAAHTLGGPDGSHPVTLHGCQAPLPVASTTPKNGGGAAVRSSQPHSVDSQRPNGTPASIPSALLPLQLQNQRQHPTLTRSARPSRVLTSEELESGRRRKQFASSSQRGVKCTWRDLATVQSIWTRWTGLDWTGLTTHEDQTFTLQP